MALFGSSGIRGDAATLFTNQFCFDIGRSFGIFLKEKKQVKSNNVAIGMDPRESSPRICEYVTKGLNFEGFGVYNEGVTCIPSMNYVLIAQPNSSASVMITGSHIQVHLNGIKFFIGNEEILKNDEELIEQIYDGVKNITSFEENVDEDIKQSLGAAEEYIQYLIKLVGKTKLPHWKIIVDAGNGAQSDIMPKVLSELGCKVIELNCSIQDELLSRDTEVASNFDILCREVLHEQADFGIGFDSDGDRAIFVDEKGKYIYGDYTGTLIAKYLDVKVIVTPINTSNVVNYCGKEVLRTKVGSPHVVFEMKEKKAGFGFEANGGCIFDNMKSRDGGRTVVEVLKILAREKKKLSELISQFPIFYINRDKFDCSWDSVPKIYEAIKDKYKNAEINDLDGLKIIIDPSSWILFRSSKNAPEFRVFTESDNEQRSKDLLNEGLTFAKSLI